MRVWTRMSLTKPSAAVLGRRLRRYLGALLVTGFGAACWSLVPPPKAEPTAGVVARAAAPLEHETARAAAFIPLVAKPAATTAARPRPIVARPHDKPRIARRPVTRPRPV